MLKIQFIILSRVANMFCLEYLKECVKRRALKSVRNNPYCSETAAKDAIESVWDICYNDTYPFERAP